MPSPERRGVLLIGVMKLIKSLGLTLLGVGVLSLMHRDVAVTLRHWFEFARVDSHGHLVEELLAKAAGLDPHSMRRLGVGTLFYAAVFATEGVGLLLGKPWAEYLTTCITVSFLPLEAYEAVLHPGLIKALVILLNIIVVIYLVRGLRRRRARERAHETSPGIAKAPPATLR